MGCLKLTERDYIQLHDYSEKTAYSRFFYEAPIATDGSIHSREVNGAKQSYKYDQIGQLTAVVNAAGAAVEQYTYDPAGNILKKYISGEITTYTYDKSNQLVSSTNNGKTTTFEYDAAGRMIKEGAKSYQYGWLDKVMSITQNKKITNSYSYSMNGQIASANISGEKENFLWDGLALIKRGTTEYVYEPAVTGGNPILANGKAMFNDILGNILGVLGEKDKFTTIRRDAFGKTLENKAGSQYNMFTGKPQIGGLGYAFLFRNYRSDLGKWQTQDPLGYPDGWNNFAYGNNAVTSGVDYQGTSWSDADFVSYYYRSSGPDNIDTNTMGLTSNIWGVINSVVIPNVKTQVDNVIKGIVDDKSPGSGSGTTIYNTSNSYSFGSVRYSLGDGSVQTYNSVTYGWSTYYENGHLYGAYSWTTTTSVFYSDIFMDPLDIGIELGSPYGYSHTWSNLSYYGSGSVLIE